MPDAGVDFLPTGDQLARERQLIEAWEQAGSVGTHPLSARERFRRGDSTAPGAVRVSEVALVLPAWRPPSR